MAIQGIFTSNQGMVGDRKGDFANAVLQIDPTGTALFLALTSGMQKTPATDTIFNWFEDIHVSGRTLAVSGGVTTTVVVVDGSFFVPGSVLMVEETGERIYVTATSGNSLTVVRGLGATAIVAITNVMNIQSIGNAQEEGSGIPVAVSQQGRPRMNYVQIFRNSWAITGTAKAISFITGSRLAKNKRDCAMYHAEDMERAFIWGVKDIRVLNNKQFRTTDGILTQIEQYGGTTLSANSLDPTVATPGSLSMTDLQSFMETVFRTNVKGQPNERMAIGGNGVIKAINRMTILDSSYHITVSEAKVGIKITEVTTPFGDLKFMTHPLMNENPAWRNEAYILHPGAIRRRELRPTFNEDYDKNGDRINGVDADQGVMTTECGIEVGAASTMGILRNVQKGVKSV